MHDEKEAARALLPAENAECFLTSWCLRLPLSGCPCHLHTRQNTRPGPQTNRRLGHILPRSPQPHAESPLHTPGVHWPQIKQHTSPRGRCSMIFRFTVRHEHDRDLPGLDAPTGDVLRAMSLPSRNNAIIERFASDVLAGARTLLVQAGLPSGFWPLALQCYCHHESVAPRDGGGENLGSSP